MYISDVVDCLKKENLFCGLSGDPSDFEFSSISCDSRNAGKGTLFFVKGVSFKREYLESAVSNGIPAYVGETDMSVGIPFIRVSDVRKAMPAVADLYYDHPYRNFRFTGVTGTKGKTSVSYLLYNIYRLYFGEKNTGIISNNEALCGDVPIEKHNNTPEALELYGILDRFASKNLSAAVMEVSSQGLAYDRVKNIRFNSGVFLNLSNDHVSPSEHHSFEEYRDAKKKLFSMCDTGFFNADDPYSNYMQDGMPCRKVTFSVNAEDSDYRASDICCHVDGSEFTVMIGGSPFRASVGLPGRFNIYNALAAICVAVNDGIPVEYILKGLSTTRISGRLETFSSKGITVIVDYAHNKASFNGLFDYVDEFYPGRRKIIVFGCTGNKALDRKKELPEIAGQRADFTVLTSDDPAFEDPEEILKEVSATLSEYTDSYVQITDREKAVEYAVSRATDGDVVILAGKGHEKTQSVKGKSVPYKGDMQCAKDALGISSVT